MSRRGSIEQPNSGYETHAESHSRTPHQMVGSIKKFELPSIFRQLATQTHAWVVVVSLSLFLRNTVEPKLDADHKADNSAACSITRVLCYDDIRSTDHGPRHLHLTCTGALSIAGVFSEPWIRSLSPTLRDPRRPSSIDSARRELTNSRGQVCDDAKTCQSVGAVQADGWKSCIVRGQPQSYPTLSIQAGNRRTSSIIISIIITITPHSVRSIAS
jgi:hypothetical protein